MDLAVVWPKIQWELNGDAQLAALPTLLALGTVGTYSKVSLQVHEE